MPPIARPLAVAALLSSVSLPAAAEITAAEVWADWQRIVEDYGPQLTVGDEARSGDSLTVTDVAVDYEFPDDAGRIAATIPEITFEELGDGTVEIRVSPVYTVSLAGVAEESGEPFSFDLLSRQPGLVTIASRDGGTTRYDYLGPELTATVENLLLEGEEVDFDIEIGLTGLNGSYEITEGTPRRFVSRTRSEDLSITAEGVDPEDPAASFAMAMNLAEVVSEGAGTISPLAAAGDLSSVFATGLETEWSLSHGPAEYTFAGVDDGDRFNLVTAAESGSFGGSISREALAYEGGNTGLAFTISSSDMPFPEVSFSMAETSGRFEMPIAPADEAGDFGLLLRMIDLDLDEALWGLFDPEGQLPRDPATLVVDLAGKARWLVDVFDPEVTGEMGEGEVPGEIESLSIDALELSVAGAEINGDGAFVFDNSGTGPFAPAPSPSGTLNLRLEGGNTLLDTLVAMGLVPEEQAMGARMMLGLFARPGTGTDTLVSTIEVGTDGSISANGQRIR